LLEGGSSGASHLSAGHALTYFPPQLSNVTALDIDGSQEKQTTLFRWHKIKQRYDSLSVGRHGDGRHVAMETERAEPFVNMRVCWLLPDHDVLVVVGRRQNELVAHVDMHASYLYTLYTKIIKILYRN